MGTVGSPGWDIDQAVMDDFRVEHNKDGAMIFSQVPTHENVPTTGIPHIQDAKSVFGVFDDWLWSWTPWGGPKSAGKTPESTPEAPQQSKGISLTVSDALPILIAAGVGFFVIKRFV